MTEPVLKTEKLEESCSHNESFGVQMSQNINVTSSSKNSERITIKREKDLLSEFTKSAETLSCSGEQTITHSPTSCVPSSNLSVGDIRHSRNDERSTYLNQTAIDKITGKEDTLSSMYRVCIPYTVNLKHVILTHEKPPQESFSYQESQSCTSEHVKMDVECFEHKVKSEVIGGECIFIQSNMASDINQRKRSRVSEEEEDEEKTVKKTRDIEWLPLELADAYDKNSERIAIKTERSSLSDFPESTIQSESNVTEQINMVEPAISKASSDLDIDKTLQISNNKGSLHSNHSAQNKTTLENNSSTPVYRIRIPHTVNMKQVMLIHEQPPSDIFDGYVDMESELRDMMQLECFDDEANSNISREVGNEKCIIVKPITRHPIVRRRRKRKVRFTRRPKPNNGKTAISEKEKNVKTAISEKKKNVKEAIPSKNKEKNKVEKDSAEVEQVLDYFILSSEEEEEEEDKNKEKSDLEWQPSEEELSHDTDEEDSDSEQGNVKKDGDDEDGGGDVHVESESPGNKTPIVIAIRYCKSCELHHPIHCCPIADIKNIVENRELDLSEKFCFMKTLPSCLLFGTVEDGNEIGIFAKTTIASNTRFGPMTGELIAYKDIREDGGTEHLWIIDEEYNGKTQCLSTEDENKANWLRYIRWDHSCCDYNLLEYIHEKQVYVVTTKEIEAGTELKLKAQEKFIYKLRKNVKIFSSIKECTTCKINFKADVFFKRHYYLIHFGHIMKMRYFCNICSEVFFGQKAIVAHASSEHSGMGLLKCKLCKKVFTTEESKKKHEETAHLNRKYPCVKCNRVLSSEELLAAHLEWHKKVYKCAECGREFARRFLLAHHENVHKGEDPEQRKRNFCDKCGKRFRDLYNLKIHMLTHSGVKPFQCVEQGCKAGFTTKQCLQIHYRKVHKYEDDNMPKITRTGPFTVEAYST